MPMNSASSSAGVKVALEISGTTLKRVVCDFPPTQIGQSNEHALDNPKLTRIAQAVAVLLVRFKLAQPKCRFTVTARHKKRMDIVKHVKTAKDSSNEQMGPLRPLANGNFLRLFKNPRGEAGKLAIEIDTTTLQPDNVTITLDGNSVESSATLKKLADDIAATFSWELADYDFTTESSAPSTGDAAVGTGLPTKEAPLKSPEKSEAHAKMKRAQELVRDSKPDEGLKLMEEALELAKQAKDDSQEVEILCGLALMSSERRHRGGRQRFLDAAEKKVTALKSSAAKVIFYRAKASACQSSRDLVGAEAAYREALRICTTEPDDEKGNLATQGCVVRSSFVHLLCNQNRLYDARPLRDECEAYARAHSGREDGELMQATLMASIHFEMASGNEDASFALVKDLESLASTSPRLANRVGTDLIETSNRTSQEDAHETAVAAAQAAIRIVPLLDKDKQHSFLVGALYTEAAVLTRSKKNDELALRKAEAISDACNHPDDAIIKQAAQHLVAEIRRCSGDSQSAVELAREALKASTSGPEEVGITKLALARSLNDNGQTEEALNEATEAWQLLRATRIPPEGMADVLSHILHYASLCGNERVYQDTLVELESVPELSERIKEEKKSAKARARAHIELRKRLGGFLREENPAAVAGTESASSFADANAKVMEPLMALWSDLPDDGTSLAGAYDIWGRGNLSRILLNAKAYGANSFNITIEVRSLEDVKRAIRLWGLYADCLILLWKGPTQGGMTFVPIPADFDCGQPGGWGYFVCSDTIQFKDSDKVWLPAVSYACSLLPPEVATFLAGEGRSFLLSGRLVVVPAVGVGCINPGHGPIEQMLAEAANAIPSIRWKGVEGTPIGLVPYSPNAPFEVLADLARSEESRLRKLRLLLLKRSRTLGSDRTMKLQAKELALEIDDALRDLAETHQTLKRKRGVQSATEPLNGTTTRFRTDGRKLSNASPNSPFAPLFLLQSLGYGWRVDSQRAISVPPRFEPGEGDVIGTWLAPPEPGWRAVIVELES